MRVGDYVRIIRQSSPQHDEYGQITRLRIGDEWYIRHESGRELSWRESSLELVKYDLAILGEGYFD